MKMKLGELLVPGDKVEWKEAWHTVEKVEPNPHFPRLVSVTLATGCTVGVERKREYQVK